MRCLLSCLQIEIYASINHSLAFWKDWFAQLRHLGLAARSTRNEKPRPFSKGSTRPVTCNAGYRTVAKPANFPENWSHN